MIVSTEVYQNLRNLKKTSADSISLGGKAELIEYLGRRSLLKLLSGRREFQGWSIHVNEPILPSPAI